jgi:hypothetical protein
MNTIGPGLPGFLVLLAMALLVHEPWRWLGWIIGRRIDPEGDVFRWVRAVSTALVCALCARLVVFPAGALEGVPLAVRLGALAIGLGVFYLGPRWPLPGILAGTMAIVVGKLALG